MGYCHQNRIVAGMETGRFEPNAYVSEKAFLTMLLQALGYKSDVDYNWDSVYQKAYEVGLSEDINDAVRTKDEYMYTRADVVHTIYNALDSKLKGKTQDLSEFLLENKVCNLYMLKKHNLIKKDKVATKIESVKAVDTKTLELTFNEDIAELKKEQLKIKKISKNLTIDKVHRKNNNKFYISVLETMYNLNKYNLTVDNIMDKDGFITEHLELEFIGADKQENIINTTKDFEIVSVKVISNNQLDVMFSRNVDKKAEEPLLYKFGLANGVLNEGNFQNLKVDLVGDSVSHVLLTFTDYRFDPNQEYTLYVRADLSNVFGERLKNGQGDQINFSGSLQQLATFEVEDTEIIDNHFIKVYFSREVDRDTALDKSNYRIIRRDGKDSRTAKNVYFYKDENGVSNSIVMVRFSSIFDDEDYELEIEDVRDVYQSQKIRRYSSQFYSGALETFEPELIGAEAVNRSEIHLIFNVPLSESADKVGVKIDRHTFISGKVVSAIEPNVLILYLRKNSYLKADEDYKVIVKRGIADYLGRKSTSAQETEFSGNEEVKPDIFISKAVMISENQMKITFSEPIKKSYLEDINLYKIKYEMGTVDRTIFPVKIVALSDNEVILKLESSYADGNMILEIEQIHSKSGQFVSKDLRIDVLK